MKFSFGPDIIPGDWLGSKHRLTNYSTSISFQIIFSHDEKCVIKVSLIFIRALIVFCPCNFMSEQCSKMLCNLFGIRICGLVRNSFKVKKSKEENVLTDGRRQNTAIIIINPLTARVIGAPQIIWQPVFSIFPCSPLPSRTCRTPSLSIPWCCLLTTSFVRLVSFPLSLCLARWFWQDLMNGKHDHTTAVCVSSRSLGGLRVVQLSTGPRHGLPRW